MSLKQGKMSNLLNYTLNAGVKSVGMDNSNKLK